MKKLSFLLVAIFVFASCSTEEEQLNVNQLLEIANFETVISDLETSLSNSSRKTINFERHEIIDIDNQFYLRSYDEKSVTTTLLEETENGFQSRGISCTSSKCSSNSNACIPSSDGKSCSPCLGGDCTKTITSGGNQQ